jgi:CRISPR/Cas system CMR-associated protein Cmr5 small subunit
MITRDQQRAKWAYKAVGEVSEDKRDNYSNAVKNLGSHILQSGLCAALAELERIKDRGGQDVLKHLADAGISHLEKASVDNLHQLVQQLNNVDQYIQVTREVLHCAGWLKRAVQALFKD